MDAVDTIQALAGRVYTARDELVAAVRRRVPLGRAVRLADGCTGEVLEVGCGQHFDRVKVSVPGRVRGDGRPDFVLVPAAYLLRLNGDLRGGL